MIWICSSLERSRGDAVRRKLVFFPSLDKGLHARPCKFVRAILKTTRASNAVPWCRLVIAPPFVQGQCDPFDPHDDPKPRAKNRAANPNFMPDDPGLTLYFLRVLPRAL
jgi:hypothetical protein